MNKERICLCRTGTGEERLETDRPNPVIRIMAGIFSCIWELGKTPTSWST
jgi:hypothetical protein